MTCNVRDYLITTIAGVVGACFRSPSSREMRSEAVVNRDESDGGALYTERVASCTGSQLAEADANRVGPAVSVVVLSAVRSVGGVRGEALARVAPLLTGLDGFCGSGGVAGLAAGVNGSGDKSVLAATTLDAGGTDTSLRRAMSTGLPSMRGAVATGLDDTTV